MNEYESHNGYVLVPEKDFRKIRIEIATLKSSLAYYRKYETNKKREKLPEEVIAEMTAKNMSPIKVFRIYRRMSQTELAQKAGISKTMISHIEKGKKQGSAQTLKNIADALDADLNDLINYRRKSSN